MKCQCGRDASVYAMDNCAGGWAGYYCLNCNPQSWTITDYLNPNGDNKSTNVK